MASPQRKLATYADLLALPEEAHDPRDPRGGRLHDLHAWWISDGFAAVTVHVGGACYRIRSANGEQMRAWNAQGEEARFQDRVPTRVISPSATGSVAGLTRTPSSKMGTSP
ncbi:MAG: hypothetical protein RL701_6976 [Pseudomonadota bacterium]|jgi:hypothetical protein